jgi:hypothetical protein
MLGDVHGDISHLPAVVEAGRPAAVIFLGDIEAPTSFDVFLGDLMAITEVWWIPGNHDTDSQDSYRHLYESALADRNLHGRVVKIAGVRIAGLGGVFRSQIWYPPKAPSFLAFEDMVANKFRHKKALTAAELARLKYRTQSPEVAELMREGQLRKHRSSIFYGDWFELCGRQADILVTHEAPSCHPHGFREIDVLAQSMKVKHAFHGHHHDCLNYRAFDAALGFQAHGVGFRGVSDMHGRTVLPGRFDEAGIHRHERDSRS